MKQELAFNELKLLLDYQSKLELVNKDLNYRDQNRIKELRDFLDRLDDNIITASLATSPSPLNDLAQF